jgi:hypothetical protein
VGRGALLLLSPTPKDHTNESAPMLWSKNEIKGSSIVLTAGETVKSATGDGSASTAASRVQDPLHPSALVAVRVTSKVPPCMKQWRTSSSPVVVVPSPKSQTSSSLGLSAVKEAQCGEQPSVSKTVNVGVATLPMDTTTSSGALTHPFASVAVTVNAAVLLGETAGPCGDQSNVKPGVPPVADAVNVIESPRHKAASS